MMGGEKRTLVGLDLSTKKIAIALISDRADALWRLGWDIRDGDLYTDEVVAKGSHMRERFDGLLEGFRNLFETLKPIEHVYIEDVSFVRGRQTELGLAQVLGGVRAHLLDMGIPYTTVNNMTWKRDLGLGGKATKAAIMQHAKDIWPLVPSSQDVADALSVLEWGMQRSLMEASRG